MFISLSKVFAKVGGVRFGIGMRLTKSNAIWYFLILSVVLTFQLMFYGGILVLWLIYAFCYGVYHGTKKVYQFLTPHIGMKQTLAIIVVFYVLVSLIIVIANIGNNKHQTTDLETPMQPTIEETTTQSTTEATIETTTSVTTEVATEATTVPTEVATEPSTEPIEATESKGEFTMDYVLNTNTRKFHYPSCSSAKQTKESNKAYFTGTREEIIQKGYSPCGRCFP